MRKSIASIAPLLLLCVSASAQKHSPEISAESCAGHVYQQSEVSRKAVFNSRPSPGLTEEAIAHGVRGQVVISAVLCSTGRITDIRVIEGLPFGVTGRAIEAVRQTTFSPAEEDGHPASVAAKFVFNYRYIGERGPLASGPLAGRMIEFVEVGGFRDGRLDEIWKRMKTRSGQVYNKEQVGQDWRMLLDAGDFDEGASTIRVEEGERGGIVVFFDLREKPRP